jgi:hypothetical protein
MKKWPSRKKWVSYGEMQMGMEMAQRLKEAEGNWPCKWMPISSNREAEAEAIQRI